MEGRVSDERSQQYEQNIMMFSRHLLSSMNKKSYISNTIKKEEFCAAVKDMFFSNGVVLVNDLFAAFVQNPPSAEEDEKKK
jgi:hypothetical protein